MRTAIKTLILWLRCHLILVTVIGFIGAGFLLRDDLRQALQPIEVHLSYGLEGERGGVRFPLSANAMAEAGASSAPDTPLATSTRVTEAPRTPSSLVRPGDNRSERPVNRDTVAQGTRSAILGQSGSVHPAVFQSTSFSPQDYHFRPLDEALDSDLGQVGRSEEDEFLNQARRAFWNDDLPGAVEHYQALIKRYPHNPDYLGELGNVYYKQGEKELAGQAYFESAVRLENQGDRAGAVKMAEFLKEIDPTYAKALEKHMDRDQASARTQ